MEIVVRDKMARLSYPRCRRFMLTRLFVAALNFLILLLLNSLNREIISNIATRNASIRSQSRFVGDLT
jgi:hypothetical protein